MTKQSVGRVPQIRFKGFEDGWEERTFEQNITSIQTGTNLLGTVSGKGTPLLKMGNIQRGYFSLERLEALDTSVQVELENIVHYGDFLFNTRNTLDLVGKGATWMGESRKFAFNSNLARFKFKGINTVFFNYLYNTQNVVSQVKARAMGTTSVAAIYPKSLNSLEYKLPPAEEQTQIGGYFRELDSLIGLHQRKHDKLVTLKKAMLQKIFPQPGTTTPEIRFKGFEGDWVEKKLGALGVFSKGQGYSKSDLTTSGTPIVLYGRLYVSYQTEISGVDTFVVEKKGSVKSIGKEVVVPASGETAEDIARASAVVTEGIILGGDLNIIYPFNELDPYFLALTISNGKPQTELAKRAQGKTVVHVRKADLESILIPFPELTEQQKIGTYFRTLDALITQHATQLQKLQQLKSACLEKMFV